MSYIGKTPTPAPLTSSDITDGIISLPKLTDGTDGNLISYNASGNPVAVATGNDGQVLTSAGAGAVPTFETLPAGGITEADQWRLTANFAPNDNNTIFITSNLERADTDGAGYIGTGMSQSSGIFTFPSTGYYLITAFGVAQGDAQYMVLETHTTTDNSSYNLAARAWSWGTSTDSYHTSSHCFLFDVTNTSTHKVKFGGYREGSSSHVNFNGDTSQSLTSFNFLRLGDT